MYRTVEINGKPMLVKTGIKKRYFYDVFLNYIRDDFRKTLVEENYELEVDIANISDLPQDEEAIPLIAHLFFESNPSHLKDEELDTVEITLVSGPLIYEELIDELVSEI